MHNILGEIESYTQDATHCFNEFISSIYQFCGQVFMYSYDENIGYPTNEITNEILTLHQEITSLYDSCSQKYITYNYNLKDYSEQCFISPKDTSIDNPNEIIKCAKAMRDLNTYAPKLKETLYPSPGNHSYEFAKNI